jgi:nitroreductase
MMPCLPDRETIELALSFATHAPSIHDFQPWLWRVGANSLHLYVDADRRGPDTDADQRDVLLSCGASLHHCVVALAALGWRADIRRFPDAAESSHLATLELYPRPASALDIVLASAIPRRRSDWRPYSSWAVSAADMALIGARAARAGVTTRRVESLPDLQQVVAETVWRHTAKAEHRGELNTVSIAAPPFSEPAAAPPLGTESADDNAVVMALGTKDDSRLARLRAGEAMSLTLLSATALGLASCPVAEPLEIDETRDALQADLSGIVGTAQVFVRLGWPPVDADPLPSPPRRPLHDVCEWVGRESLTNA